MKRFTALAVAFLMLVSMCGCSEKENASGSPTTAQTEIQMQTVPASEQTEIQTEAQSVTTEAEETTQESTEAEAAAGELFLTVSQMTFSVVGEQEDIYCGSLPREAVTWESVDPEVATVENGVVTAVGTGSTTVSASYQNQRVDCVIGCLADDADALAQLSADELTQPRKLPPMDNREVCHFFDDTAFIGDSVSYSLMLWATQNGEMGDATFLVRGGNGIAGYVNHYKTIGFQGEEMDIEEAVMECGAKKVFIMMGVNDLGFMSVEQTMDYYRIMVDRILEKSPDVQIYVESCLPVWDAGIQGTKNVDVDAFNAALEAYAEEMGFYYVEMASYIEDHTGGMPKAYCSDFSTHMNYDGTDVWMQALKLYANTHGFEE